MYKGRKRIAEYGENLDFVEVEAGVAKAASTSEVMGYLIAGCITKGIEYRNPEFSPKLIIDVSLLKDGMI